MGQDKIAEARKGRRARRGIPRDLRGSALPRSWRECNGRGELNGRGKTRSRRCGRDGGRGRERQASSRGLPVFKSVDVFVGVGQEGEAGTALCQKGYCPCRLIIVRSSFSRTRKAI